MKRVTILLILLILIFSMPSCAQEATDKGHDMLKKELSTTQEKLSATESELQETREGLTVTREELNLTRGKLSSNEETLTDTLNEVRELKSELADVSITRDQYQSLYEELSIKYEEMKEEYDAITGEATDLIINEEEVEQAVFALINQERTNNGFSELIWNDGLHSCARTNNYNMAETKSLQDSACLSFQQVFWFLGYGTADIIAETALTAWKNNQYSYEQNVLNNSVYGAVAVYRPEDILYISFLAYTDIHVR